MGSLHALLLRPLGEARTWRATLHLLGGLFWSVANTLVLLGGLIVALSPIPAMVTFGAMFSTVGFTVTASGWLVLVLLVLTIPIGVLGFIGTAYAVEGCARLEVGWHRSVLGVDI